MPQFSTVMPTSTGSSVLRFQIVSIDAKVNMIHRCGNRFGRWGWFEPRRRWQMQIFGPRNFAMYCHCADNSDDVHDGVRLKQRRSDDGNVGILVCPK